MAKSITAAARLGEVLRNRGISRGDRVLLCLPDSPELVELLLACLARGILAFLANPDSHPEDHAFQERDTEPALVVTSGALRARFQRSSVVSKPMSSCPMRAESSRVTTSR